LPKSGEKFHLKIKAVLFDLGNTLVKSFSLEIVFHKILSSFDIHIPLEKIKEAVEKTESEFGNIKNEPTYGKASYEEFWNEWDSRVLIRLGLPEDKKIVEGILTRWFDYAECDAYSEVKDTLYKLKQMGLKIGIVSGAYEEDISLILERAHLQKELFDITVGANTIEKAKPHPDVFKYALKKLNIKPDEALFIGDAVETDYKGAEKVGIKAVLIQRTETKIQKANFRTINSLNEIFNFIG
jgi:putative hydrolase of the HAD superfamily